MARRGLKLSRPIPASTACPWNTALRRSRHNRPASRIYPRITRCNDSRCTLRQDFPTIFRQERHDLQRRTPFSPPPPYRSLSLPCRSGRFSMTAAPVGLEHQTGFWVRLSLSLGASTKPYVRMVLGGGFRSDFVRIPAQRLSRICLCNRSDADATAMSRQIARLFLTDLR